MQSNTLAALIRSTLLAGLTARGGSYATVQVLQVYQPQTEGIPIGPTVTMQPIGSYRYGALGRSYAPTDDPDEMAGTMLQWWTSTWQIGAIARRNPQAADFLTLPSAMDICKVASDILQSDAGLDALAVVRVRPLRIADIRLIQWVNESDQFEAWPLFDLTLVYPEILSTTTPPVVTFEPVTGRV